MKRIDPSMEIQDYLVFGEYGGVNPSISDSSTYTFLEAEMMEEAFTEEKKGCFLYGRHKTPTNNYLGEALARMEYTEAALPTASGMSAIHSTVMQLCSAGDHIICSRTVYGGTYALFKNILSRLDISTTFVDIQDLNAVEKAYQPNTRLIYCESLSNPLLGFSSIPDLSKITRKHGIKLVVDNTFSPLLLSPARQGADIVIHSLTKFINGASDCIAGCICSSKAFIDSLTDVNSGLCMLSGPVLDALRSASILKNLHTLHLRIKQHSKNALFFANELQEYGFRVHYPGLESHPDHEGMKGLMNLEYGFGGILAFDVGSVEKARDLVIAMQQEQVGYFAVSLGFYKTLFSVPGSSTSSEIPEEDRKRMGLSTGIIRISIGIDNHPEESWKRMKKALKQIDKGSSS